MTSTVFVLITLSVVAVCFSLIILLAGLNKKPKVDKQLAVLDAYIDSVAKSNGFKMPDESSSIDRKKLFEKIIKKLMKDIQKVADVIGCNSHKYIHVIKYKDFVFGPYGHIKFQGSNIYGEISKWEGLYNYTGWYLSPEKTTNLAKQWPEAKLEVLRLFRERKQRGISEYNKAVDELATLV